MVLSMTGFGSASSQNAEIKIDVEVKSLNSKYLDLNLRLPKLLQALEIDIRQVVNREAKRGKIALSFNVQVLDASKVKRNINSMLFNAYAKDLKDLSKQHSLDQHGLLEVLMNLPDMLEANDQEIADDTRTLVLNTLTEALGQLKSFRKAEGDNLQQELAEYAKRIQQKSDEIDACKDLRIQHVKQKLHELQEKYLNPDKIDANRYEQEVVFYLERLDITEEIVRLRGHVQYFLQELSGNGSGKKLGFIAQEMGREINTIGSKANHEQIQRLVVDMKEELEKIKEQVLNLL